MGSALAVDGLTVGLGKDGPSIVDDVSFAVKPGEILALVGESGSGKTTIGLALLAYARSGARIRSGSVQVGGEDVLAVSERRVRSLRGTQIAYVPQDPMTALNPAMRVDTQLREVLEFHAAQIDAGDSAARIAQTLEDIGLPADEGFLKRFPHQLSGGQQQRVTLAMAVLTRPSVVICDEPTTGLDVTTQASVLKTIRSLCGLYGTAVVYITHDLAVVAELADRVMVLYGGRIAEMGSREDLFARPAHPYTARLLGSSPDLAAPRQLATIPGHPPSPSERPAGCIFAPRCEMRIDKCAEEPPLVAVSADHLACCHRAAEVTSIRPPALSSRAVEEAAGPALEVDQVSVRFGSTLAVRDASFTVAPGECVALVGGSGSGKTTLAKVIVGLQAPHGGHVRALGEDLAPSARERSRRQRQQLQYVFQNPYASLNPRHTVRQSLASPLRLLGRLSREEVRARTESALEKVALSARHIDSYPDQLSGGERQRVALARALVLEPSVLVCDEVTSALDVSVQAAVVDRLLELQAESGFALLFITHNLALVRTVAQHVVVMEKGSVVDRGPTEKLLTGAAVHSYTEQLLSDTPSISRVAERAPRVGARA